MRTVLRFCFLAASLAVATAHAQTYCPAPATYYSSNYGSSCTTGTCWATTPFPGSQSTYPLGYSGYYYSCSTTTPPAPPSGKTTTHSYDNQGNLTSVNGPLAGTVDVTTNTYDALNRHTRITDPSSGQTNYGYNALDQLVSVSDPRSLATTYTLNALGDLTQQISPDTGTTGSTYGSGGNLATQTDAKSQVSTYTYDVLNRVTQVVFHDGSKHLYGYDAGTYGKGQLTSIEERDPVNVLTGSHGYVHDPRGRVTSNARTIAGVSYSTAYRYDVFGRVDQITYPSGRKVDFTFDSLGRVSGVTTTPPSGSAETLASSITYFPFGGLAGLTFGNAQTYARSYDQAARVNSYTLAGASYAVLYDDASRVSAITETLNPPNSNTYGYDTLDRLTSAVLPGTTYGYSYDAVGNRLTRTAGAGTDTYTYGTTSNRIATLTPSSGPARTFALDSNGSTTADGLNTYAYDVRGRMVSATSSLGTTTYTVNALGQRTRKTNSFGDTVFHYDLQGHLIAESTATGTTLREYVWLSDTPIAVLTSAGRHYVHTDHLNTPRLVANQTPATVWRWDQFEPFGVNAANDNPSGLGAFEQPLRFPGQYVDKETNLHYNYFRDYDSAIGRYVESDPIGLRGGLNTYLYVSAKPIHRFDIKGLQDETSIAPSSSNLEPTSNQWEGQICYAVCIQRRYEQFTKPLVQYCVVIGVAVTTVGIIHKGGAGGIAGITGTVTLTAVSYFSMQDRNDKICRIDCHLD